MQAQLIHVYKTKLCNIDIDLWFPFKIKHFHTPNADNDIITVYKHRTGEKWRMRKASQQDKGSIENKYKQYNPMPDTA